MTDRIQNAIDALDKATPGPWKSGGCVVWKFDGDIIADLAFAHNAPTNTEANATLIAAAPDLAAEVIRLRKAIIEYEMALASEGALILNHEGHIAKLNAEISRLRKRQSEAMKLIDGCLAMPSELADRLIAEAEEDTND